MRRYTLALLLTLSAIAVSAQESKDTKDKPTDYQLQMHVMIPMRDGVHLNATIYRPVPTAPATENPPLPVIFNLSPSPAATAHPSGNYFAQRGYIYAYVDTRGRGDSEGVFHPLTQELEDGPDVVEWFAKQPWCNGKVAMFGGSYAGGDQWQTAASHPPHLVTIAPVASVRPGVDFPVQFGVGNPYMLIWATYTSGHTLYESIFADNTVWNNAAKRLFLAKAPFNQFPTYAGSTGTDFETWLQHPDVDSYWHKYGLTREQVAGVKIPTLVVTGDQDGDEPGTLSYYADHITTTDKATLDNYYVVIGPWNHEGTREPKADFDGEHYGPASLVDVLRLHREWYDFTMKSGAKPAFLQNHVAYYVSGTGAECWKYADSLAAVSKKSETLYLDATGGATSIYHSGSLATTQDGAAGATFISDPNDLSGAEDNDGQPGAGLHGDGLIFHTAPFTEATEIDGFPELRLWLSIDTPDTDLGYELYLLTPDGKHHFLDTTILRARYRNSLGQQEAIHQNQPELYVFKPYYWFATRAPKGSQLRLIVAAINTPQVEKNYNSMKPVAEQTGADARVAHITLLQTKDHPSTLTLPLGDTSASCKASADW
jgi:putative CocE/NonD family hydrolase